MEEFPLSWNAKALTSPGGTRKAGAGNSLFTIDFGRGSAAVRISKVPVENAQAFEDEWNLTKALGDRGLAPKILSNRKFLTTSNGNTYSMMVMELKYSLKDYLDSNCAGLNELQKSSLSLKIVELYDKLVALGVYCFDVKPGNMVLSQDLETVFIIDVEPLYCGTNLNFFKTVLGLGEYSSYDFQQFIANVRRRKMVLQDTGTWGSNAEVLDEIITLTPLATDDAALSDALKWIMVLQINLMLLASNCQILNRLVYDNVFKNRTLHGQILAVLNAFSRFDVHDFEQIGVNPFYMLRHYFLGASEPMTGSYLLELAEKEVREALPISRKQHPYTHTQLLQIKKKQGK